MAAFDVFEKLCLEGRLKEAQEYRAQHESILHIQLRIQKDWRLFGYLVSEVGLRGHLEVVRWLVEQVYETGAQDNEEERRKLCKSAFCTMLAEEDDWTVEWNKAVKEEDFLNTLKWLYAKCPFDTVPSEMSDDEGIWIYERLVVNGWLNVLKWLVEMFPEVLEQMKDGTRIDDSLLVIACRGGYLEMAKWLVEVVDPEMDMWERDGSNFNAFENACIHGHLDVAKWLVSVHPAYVRRDEDGEENGESDEDGEEDEDKEERPRNVKLLNNGWEPLREDVVKYLEEVDCEVRAMLASKE